MAECRESSQSSDLPFGGQRPEQPGCAGVPLAASVADDSEGGGREEKEPHPGAAGVAGVRIEGGVAQ